MNTSGTENEVHVIDVSTSGTSSESTATVSADEILAGIPKKYHELFVRYINKDELSAKDVHRLHMLRKKISRSDISRQLIEARAKGLGLIRRPVKQDKPNGFSEKHLDIAQRQLIEARMDASDS